MNFDPVLLAPRMQQMKAENLWRDETINTFFKQALDRCPDKLAITSFREGKKNPIRLSYRELEKKVDQIARGLFALGVGPSDVVTYQLPNCWEFIAISLACARLGAVANPVMHIFRQHELNFILNFGESKIFIVPKSFRQYDYETMAHGMKPNMTHLQHLIIVDGDGEDSFEHMLLRDDTPKISLPGLAPDDVMLLMYTSGTTGEPKGVMHTSNTLFSNLHPYIEIMELDHSDITLGASPMAHLTGYGYLAMIPIILNSTTVLMDVWDAKRALQIIRDENVTFSMSSAIFVSDMCMMVEKGEPTSERFKKYNCAGAPIPSVLIERAHQLMGLTISSAWGMTECGAVTVTEPAKAIEKSGVSDGRPLRGMDVKITNSDNERLSAGETGRLFIRGASLFAGYLKRPHLNDVDKEGWFDTGDLAFIDNDGYIRIAGRNKDVVIRGGENIPVVEIENLLYKHPAIMHVAVVGYPDKRFGERVCAFVALKPEQTFSFEDMINYLSERRVSKTYFPERLEVLAQMPQTPSGKLQKFKLRELARTFEEQ